MEVIEISEKDYVGVEIGSEVLAISNLKELVLDIGERLKEYLEGIYLSRHSTGNCDFFAESEIEKGLEQCDFSYSDEPIFSCIVWFKNYILMKSVHIGFSQTIILPKNSKDVKSLDPGTLD